MSRRKISNKEAFQRLLSETGPNLYFNWEEFKGHLKDSHFQSLDLGEIRAAHDDVCDGLKARGFDLLALLYKTDDTDSNQRYLQISAEFQKSLNGFLQRSKEQLVELKATYQGFGIEISRLELDNEPKPIKELRAEINLFESSVTLIKKLEEDATSKGEERFKSFYKGLSKKVKNTIPTCRLKMFSEIKLIKINAIKIW